MAVIAYQNKIMFISILILKAIDSTWKSKKVSFSVQFHLFLFLYIYIYIPKRINREARKVAKAFDVTDRVDTMEKQECLIMLKDHKEDYSTNPKYQLLNPTKHQLGKISKQISQKINKTLKSKLNLNQWQNSSQVIDWLKNIQQKSSHTFTVFDIQELYPSMKEKLLKDALAFAQKYVEIKQNKLDLIFQT